MIQFNVKYKSNLIPVLSRKDIEEIAQKLLSDFRPDCLENPKMTDMEGMLMNYLGMNYTEEYLSCNGLYLGLTTFKDERLVIFSQEKNRAEYADIKANTVVIDRSLCGSQELSGRKRFTMAHEAGHVVLHRKYYEKSGKSESPQMHDGEIMSEKNSSGNSTDEKWLEWQADNFASSILMPRQSVIALSRRYKNLDEDTEKEFMVVAVSTIFGVSEMAALIRLKSIGIIDKNYSPDISELKYLRQFRSGLRTKRDGGR